MSENLPPAPQYPAPQVEQAKTLKELIREKAPDVLTSIPPDKQALLTQVRIERQVSMRRGPLPDPGELAAYNQIIPNGADRIMKMAEEQSAHRIGLEKTVVGSQQR